MTCDRQNKQEAQNESEEENSKKLTTKEKKAKEKETLYIGETSKSLSKRSGWHFDRYKSLQTDSFMLRHRIKFHPDIPEEEYVINFDTLKHHEKPMIRMIHEAIEIRKLELNPNKTSMNN